MRNIANGNKEALKVVDELERLSENDEFRVLYDAEKMRRKEINSARLDGYDAGKVEGLREGKISIAKNFLKDGISIEVISKNTGLSVEELKELNKEA